MHHCTINSKVWLIRKHIKTTRPSPKLDYNKIGPYTVIQKVGNNAYKLQLPVTMKIHPVFHVSLLEPVTEDTLPDRHQAPPPSIMIDHLEEYEVDKILDCRIHSRRLEYLVDWKGYDTDARTWEPTSNLYNSRNLIQEFHIKNPLKPKPHRAQPLKEGSTVMVAP